MLVVVELYYVHKLIILACRCILCKIIQDCQLLAKVLMPRCSWSEEKLINRSTPWKSSKKNTSWKKTKRRISWPKRVSSVNSTTPSWFDSNSASKMIKNCTSSCSTVPEESYSACSHSKTSCPKNSKSYLIKSQVLLCPNIFGFRCSASTKCDIPRVFLNGFSLKPENVLLDKNGYIKLTDFGLSRTLDFED